MFEYKLIKLNNSALPKLGKEGRSLTTINEGIMYFQKAIKKTRNTTIDKESHYWLEFITEYRKLNNNGSYDKRLIKKYHEVIKETPHDDIMNNLKDYKTYLEVKKKQKYALQVGTYLNKRSYKNEWEIIEDMSKKYINDIYKEKELTTYEIENINTEIQAYELKHKREVTDGVVRNMIEGLLNK